MQLQHTLLGDYSRPSKLMLHIYEQRRCKCKGQYGHIDSVTSKSASAPAWAAVRAGWQWPPSFLQVVCSLQLRIICLNAALMNVNVLPPDHLIDQAVLYYTHALQAIQVQPTVTHLKNSGGGEEEQERPAASSRLCSVGSDTSIPCLSTRPRGR